MQKRNWWGAFIAIFMWVGGGVAFAEEAMPVAPQSFDGFNGFPQEVFAPYGKEKQALKQKQEMKKVKRQAAVKAKRKPAKSSQIQPRKNASKKSAIVFAPFRK